MRWKKRISSRQGILTGNRRPNPPIAGILLILGLLSLPVFSKSLLADETWTGCTIMDEVFKRHERFPYVFEKQTMILIDSAGNRDVRQVRRFSRVETDATVKYLLVFDYPNEIRGVALLAIRRPSGRIESKIYLPALGKKLKSVSGKSRGDHLLGTDFTIEDLGAEVLSGSRYVRKADYKIGKILYFVVEAFPKDLKIEKDTGYGLRRHFIRKDNFYIVRTDYYDPQGRLIKRRTCHDLKNIDGTMWRANMILMENYKEQHKTLIKINQRIFSHDYVPPEMFAPEWLLENRHIQSTEDHLFRNTPESSGKNDKGLKDNP